MRSFLRYFTLIGAVLGIVTVTLALAVLALSRPAGFIGDGDYELTIFLKSKSDTPVQSVRCFLYPDASEAVRKAADRTQSYLSDTPWYRAGEGFDSKSQKVTFFAPFTVSNKIGIFGGIYDELDWQYKGILIEGKFESGRHFRVAAEIPSRHLMDKIEVDVP